MGCFVLQNRYKQTVRAFRWDNPSLTLVFRNDLNRVEAVRNTDDLDEQEIAYSVLLTTTKADVQKRNIAVGSYGYLSYDEKSTGVLAPSFALEEEKDQERFKTMFLYSGAGHIGVVVLLMLISFIVNKWFPEEKIEPVVINLEVPKLEVPVEKKKVQTVKVAEKKIEKVLPKPHQKASNVTKHVPPKPKKVTVVKNKPIRKNVPANVQPQRIDQMGALSALTATRRKGSAMSLNLNGVGTGEGGRGSGGRGYGGNGRGGGGLGEGLKGGASGALPGKGLIASSPGTGSQAAGAGGYGSSGSGGGRLSEGGAISFRGQSGAFMRAIPDEASFEAGLDRDQIIAVVQKNMGQIIYCYEMGLQSKPNLKGRLTAAWVINGSGRVNTSAIDYSSVGDNKVESCIAGKIKTWKFPKPVGGVNVDVTYPFELRRMAQR